MAIKEGQLIKYKNSFVDARDLSHGSNKEVICICDFCGKEVEKRVNQYYEIISKHNGKYCCKDCCNHNKELLTERTEKTKSSCDEKYGVDNVGAVKEFKEKREKTCIEKYGVKNPIELADTTKAHSKEAREKALETIRKRHGGCGFELDYIREKALTTLANSGKVPISSQQKSIYELVKRIFVESEECELNKPVSTLCLDISLKIKGVLIDIECDGKYWHQDSQKDRARDEVVKSFGYKVLRIKYDHSIPSKEELEESINKLINTNHKYYELILSDY